MEKKSGNSLFKRIVAIIGIIILVGNALVFLWAVLFLDMSSASAFAGWVEVSIGVPILMWLILWAYSAMTGNRTVASADPYGRLDDAPAEADKDSDNKITTVIFDIGDVLVDFCWEDFIRNKGYSEDMVRRIGDATVRNPVWNEYDRGEWTTEQIIDGFVKKDPEIEEDIRKTFSDLSGLLKKRERTIPWIRALKKEGYKVLVLSNFSKQAIDANPFMNEFLDEVDGGILSYKDKVIKPDPAIYKLLMERNSVKPSECVFIDDMPRNIEAARALGINGIIFRSYDQVDKELEKLGVRFNIA